LDFLWTSRDHQGRRNWDREERLAGERNGLWLDGISEDSQVTVPQEDWVNIGIAIITTIEQDKEQYMMSGALPIPQNRDEVHFDLNGTFPAGAILDSREITDTEYPGSDDEIAIDDDTVDEEDDDDDDWHGMNNDTAATGNQPLNNITDDLQVGFHFTNSSSVAVDEASR
jgi:hypothetical protein